MSTILSTLCLGLVSGVCGGSELTIGFLVA